MVKDRIQKNIVVDIDANTQDFITAKQESGYGIVSVTNLTPTFDKLLIIYYDPPIIPQ